jgi:DNA-binding NtrC family response regulator
MVFMRILVVDDQEDELELFEHTIARISDSTSVLAVSCTEAIHVLENDAPLPDMIFIDIRMPKIDGLVCLAEIKANPKFRSIPIIMWSNYRYDSIVDKARMLDAEFYLKPVGETELLKLLYKIINQQRKPIASKSSVK